MPTRRSSSYGAPVGSAARAWNFLRQRGSRANRAAASRAFRATSFLARGRRAGAGAGAGGSGSSGG